MTSVLDASALLAYLRDEPGASVVADAIAKGTSMSTLNVAEVLSRATDRGADPDQLAQELTARGLLRGAIDIEPLTLADAVDIARLRPLTRTAGLSMGDRACLALARRLGIPTLTSVKAWIEVDVDVEVTLIGEPVDPGAGA